MTPARIHLFERDGTRFAIDTETCFCFECDEISWDVLHLYPHTPVNRIYHDLQPKHDIEELKEVVGELEWLRATKSILPDQRLEEDRKRLELERGLREVVVALPDDAQGERSIREISRGALTLLLSRSRDQSDLSFQFNRNGALGSIGVLEELVTEALKAGMLAGKSVAAKVSVIDMDLGKPPPSMEGHRISAVLEFEGVDSVAPGLHAFQKSKPNTLPRLSKAFAALGENALGRVVVRPGNANFADALKYLDDAGFTAIEFDLDGAFVAAPEQDPGEIFASLEKAAEYYSERLRAHHYFRVDPIAFVFSRIYNGTPLRRADPAGMQSLFVTETGDIYPSVHFRGVDAFKIGSVTGGRLDEAILKAFQDIGALTTSKCIGCWARNLCGGGCSAVHHARTGSIHEPDDDWCDGQRAWLDSAVSSFNSLKASEVNFSRVYSNLAKKKAPSLFTMARAAFRMNIGMRPLEEGDAKVLAKWESWNRAAYFLMNERLISVASEYEREMDAIHPWPLEHELMLIRKDGTPMGLFKLCPDRTPGLADGFVYFRNESDYESAALQRSFRAVLKEASVQQSIRRLLVPTAPWESGLQVFLERVGFVRAGAEREAMFCRGAYHDVQIFSLTAEAESAK